MAIDIDKSESGFENFSLKRNPTSPRTLFGLIMSSIAGFFTLLAIIPLFIILSYLLTKGISSLSPAVFTELPPPPMVEGGGFGNAIIGTVIMVGIGALISVPIGVISAIYLSEINQYNTFDLILFITISSTIAFSVIFCSLNLIPNILFLSLGIILNLPSIVNTLLNISASIILNSSLGLIAFISLPKLDKSKISVIKEWIRFATNVLSGVPSIIVGVFAYSAIVLTTKTYSAWAGGFALSILMLPIIVRTTDEALKLVPQEVRQASVGIGANQYQTVLQVVLPAALPAIITGVTLSIARAAGETAPLLFTALFTQYWPNWDNGLAEPTASLAVLVYNFAIVPFKNQQDLAWGAAFILVLLVLVTSIISRVATAKRTY